MNGAAPTACSNNLAKGAHTMRTKPAIVLLLAASAAASLSAHVTVSPLVSKPGAVQKYELRVHNEAKVAATSVDLDIPDGVTVTDVAKKRPARYPTKGGRYSPNHRDHVARRRAAEQVRGAAVHREKPGGCDRLALEHARTPGGRISRRLERQTGIEGEGLCHETRNAQLLATAALSCGRAEDACRIGLPEIRQRHCRRSFFVP